MMDFSGLHIATVYPVYYALLCAVAAGWLTWLLYRKHFFESRLTARIMAVLRFSGLFVVFFLLLAPLFRLKVRKEQKPLLLLMEDRSFSINRNDSALVLKSLDALKPQLESNFDVRHLVFGAEVALEQEAAGRDATSLSSAIDRINETFENRPTGAAVIISDGIYNTGVNPLFKGVHHGIPLHTVGLGDTVQHPDLWISGLAANATAFLGNDLVLECQVRGYGIQGGQTRLDLFEDGKRVGSKPLSIQESPFFQTVEFVVAPKTPGPRNYEVRLAEASGEHNVHNNRAQTWVNVTDTRRRIGICYHAPHPDVGAIARALEQFGQYEIFKFPLGSAPKPGDADLFILHGFGAQKQEEQWVRRLLQENVPFFFILGNTARPQFVNFREAGVAPVFQPGMVTEATGMYNEGFSEFLTGDFAAEVGYWPPLRLPSGKYTMPAGFRTLLHQRIGAVPTDFPLAGFTQNGSVRQAWLFGEGIWRWRIYDHKLNGHTEAFDEWLVKTVQYLTSGDLRNHFRAFTQKNNFKPGEGVRIYAEYLDASGNLVNKPDCELTVKGSGYARTIKMARSGNRYLADLGQTGAGNFVYTATLSGIRKTAAGKYSVEHEDLEQRNLTADHGLLRKMAAGSKGLFFKSSEFERLTKTLQAAPQTKVVLKEEVKVTDFIHMKWIFAALIAVFSAEWFLRKREGGY